MHRQTQFLLDRLGRAERASQSHTAGHGYVGFINPEVLAVRDIEGKTALLHAREQGLVEIADRIERYLETIIELETRGIEQDSRHRWHHYWNRGLCHRALGNDQQAELDLTQALELRTAVQ